MYKCDDQYPDLVLMKKENLAGGVLELVAQPVEPLVETVARGGAGGLKEGTGDHLRLGCYISVSPECTSFCSSGCADPTCQ